MRRGRAAAVGLLAALLLAGCTAHRPDASPAPTRSAATASPTASPTEAPAPVVATIGDSIMAGFGLPRGDDWPTMLAAQDGFQVANLGCPSGGFVAVGMCGTDFAGLIAGAAAAHPSVVIVESSSNDRDRSDATLDAATRDTLTALRQRLPAATIVGVSTVWNAGAWQPHEISASSASLRAATASIGGRFVDIGQPLLGHPEWMQPDGIHPTLDGQRALAQTIDADLRSAGVIL